MLFIYWGWDTAVSVNEETEDPHIVPGTRRGRSRRSILLAIYVLVILVGAVLRRASAPTPGIGLGNTAQPERRAVGPRHSIFGTSGFGSLLVAPARC